MANTPFTLVSNGRGMDVALICPGLVRSELAKETQEGMDTDNYAAILMKQIKVGEVYIMSHAYNFVRISARWRASRRSSGNMRRAMKATSGSTCGRSA